MFLGDSSSFQRLIELLNLSICFVSNLILVQSSSSSFLLYVVLLSFQVHSFMLSKYQHSDIHPNADQCQRSESAPDDYHIRTG